MKKVQIIIEKAFVLNPVYQLEEILKCFEKLNQLIRQKNNLPDDKIILWGKIDNGKIRIGYNGNPDSVNRGMHCNVLLEYDINTNKAIFQFVVFDAINEWGLYEQAPVYGAPEEDQGAGFKFTLEETEYHYVVYIESSLKKI